MATSLDDLITFCRLHLGEGDAERLVGWIAWRTGRNQAMAGAGPAIDRLRHAAEHWLDDDRRDRLLRWLRRRVAEGAPPVPD
ncbi:hypothetical protein [Miltoncostaea marina]|uniref:hypothetical protein n=1 Tax=Miltoncostaea marina TaxID=2843215 RepID=UPI001C3D9E03|nr:hypothetical protein [Miltoncostaea marina]